MQPRRIGSLRQPAHLLRLHLEALWGCTVPPLDRADVEVAGVGVPLVYQGDWSDGSVRLWRSDVAPSMRPRLIAALESGRLTPGLRLHAEVALAQTEPPRLSVAEAERIARLIGDDEHALVNAFEPDAVAYYLGVPSRKPVVGVVVDRRLVAVAHSSRRTPLACELGVETLPQYRRRGYGLAVTVLWTAAVQTEGIVPIYSALAENASSLALANAAGYRPFARGVAIVPDGARPIPEAGASSFSVVE